MIYSVYWVENEYPCKVITSVVDTTSEESSGYGNATFIGKSSVKAEILSRNKIISFINENNEYMGVPIFSKAYIKTIQDEIDKLVDAYPEEVI